MCNERAVQTRQFGVFYVGFEARALRRQRGPATAARHGPNFERRWGCVRAVNRARSIHNRILHYTCTAQDCAGACVMLNDELAMMFLKMEDRTAPAEQRVDKRADLALLDKSAFWFKWTSPISDHAF